MSEPSTPKPKTEFTPEEEALIKAAMEEQDKKLREAQLDNEIQNRIMDENRGKPGYKY